MRPKRFQHNPEHFSKSEEEAKGGGRGGKRKRDQSAPRPRRNDLTASERCRSVQLAASTDSAEGKREEKEEGGEPAAAVAGSAKVGKIKPVIRRPQTGEYGHVMETPFQQPSMLISTYWRWSVY
ncbi:hypothetical protein GWI33_004088 [Rhynchophorus ferrugineus]|uniref:Uncharacterized protein n=1 Tax=Rhynchophorus ferrugineus TaxID=354439 RepID=A0A834IMR0_RHYFE|nr:hypothetical protein GWI33_004088 [Rhynchophorus ferrugineus]